MLGTGRYRAGAGPLGITLVVLAGGFIAVVSTYLLINPGGLHTYLYIGYAARFVPLLFLGVVALIWPMLILMFALAVMFGGAALTDLLRPLFPTSPFWLLLVLTLGAQMARNIHRNKAVPWGEGTMLMFLALWAALYNLEGRSFPTLGILLPLFAGFALVGAVGLLRTWRQIAVVLVALYVAFALLEWQLLPFLIPSWGSSASSIRTLFGGLDSSLRQATSLDWLFNMMALLSLGMAIRRRGMSRMALLTLSIAFAVSSLLTFSRGAYVGMAGGILALLLVEGRGSFKGLLWVVVAGAVLFGLAYYSGSWASNAGQRSLGQEIRALQLGEPRRLTILLDGVKEMPQHLMVGRGPVGTPAHSAFLDIWNNYGGIYAAGLWGLILVLFRRSYRMAKAAPEGASSPWGSAITLGLYGSFAAAIANSLLDPTFFTLSFPVVFWLMRGLEIGIWKSGLAGVNVKNAAADAGPGSTTRVLKA